MDVEMNLSSSLLQLLQEVSSEPNPDTALVKLLDTCVSSIGASAGRLYRLNLAQSAYTCVHTTCQECAPPHISTDVLDQKQAPASYMEEVIRNRRPRIVNRPEPLQAEPHFCHAASALMLIPVVRDNGCLGVLTFEADRLDYFTPEMQEFGCSGAAACLLLLEKKRSLDLLKALQHPLNYVTDLKGFLTEMVLVIAESSGMPFIIVRVYDPDLDPILDCKAQLGFDKEYENDPHFLDLKEVPETFRPVLERGVSVVAADSFATDLPNLVLTGMVKSFVATPIKVGDQVFGVLSFGSACTYEFTPLEIAGFEIIANGIGIAIKNFFNYHTQFADVYGKSQISTVITAVEVAQAARHEARGYLESAQTKLLALHLGIAKQNREDVQKNLLLVNEVSEELLKISQSIERIKSITKPLVKERKVIRLADQWKEAFNLVRGRLVQESIEYRIDGRNVELEAYPDFLQHAFLNLILNSIDAFREYGKRRDRQITVQIDTPSERDKDVRMTYTDNASGIDVTKLRRDADGKQRDVQDIFEMGITSKPAGSGFGLYLVRKIMEDHKGSINLDSWRGGVRFSLVLPKELPADSPKRR